jgi:hypothetical protein
MQDNNKQQKDNIRATNAFESSSFIRKLKYLFLNSAQKRIYKELLKNSKTKDAFKTDFNKENVFEVVNFNF